MRLRFVAIVLASYAVCVLLLMVMHWLIDLNNQVMEPLEAAPLEFFRSRLSERPERLSYRPVRPSRPRLPLPAPAFAEGMGGFLPEKPVIICGCCVTNVDLQRSIGFEAVALALQPYVVEPVYPREAWGKDRSGWVLLRFDVASVSATVVDHCA